MSTRTALMMVTHAKDLEFAHYSFQSVSKFATGFDRYVVVVPIEDRDLFRTVAEPYGFIVKSFHQRPGKGFLHHEAIICEGDLWCPGADAILHLDADNLFTAPVTPADYLECGKPILWRERYEDFRTTQGTRYSWKTCVRNATGIDPEFETMLRHPSVHLPQVYRKTRELIQAHTGLPYLEYILSCRNEYPQTFAEFPTLGAVALEYFPGLYSWVTKEGDRWTPDPGPNKLFNFWSHGGLSHVNDRHPGRTAGEVVTEILSR